MSAEDHPWYEYKDHPRHDGKYSRTEGKFTLAFQEKFQIRRADRSHVKGKKIPQQKKPHPTYLKGICNSSKDQMLHTNTKIHLKTNTTLT